MKINGLRKVIAEDFKKILNEELGISLEICGFVDLISEYIKKDIILNKRNFTSDEHGAKLYSSSKVFTFNNVNIIVFYHICNLFNKKNFDLYWDYYNQGNQYNEQNNTIQVFVPMYNGQIDTEILKSSLQHEIVHFYDSIKHNNQLLNISKTKLYTQVQKIMNNTTDHALYDLSFALYLCFQTERIAFANSFYRKIAENPSCKTNTMEYHALSSYKNTLNNWDTIQKYCNVFGVSTTKCKTLIEKGYKDYLRALCRAYQKGLTDYTNNGGEINTQYKNF